jgi:hypothetical protein
LPSLPDAPVKIGSSKKRNSEERDAAGDAPVAPVVKPRRDQFHYLEEPTIRRNPGINSKIMTAKSLADLPDTIFCNILEYLDWGDVARFDTAVLDRNMRKSYLVALKLRNVKVERNRFWSQAVEKGILNWLVSRNIPVISWDLKVDNTELMTIANGLPLLQSLRISYSHKITDEGIRALASGCTQLQSLNIDNCDPRYIRYFNVSLDLYRLISNS